MSKAVKRKYNKTGKVLTGFCGIGACEGTRPRSKSGQPLKTCPFDSSHCKCMCHADIDELYKSQDIQRIQIHNPEYVKTRSPYTMPSVQEIMAARQEREDVPKARIINEGQTILESAPVSFEPTPDGKRQRGQLEEEVLAVCTAFVKGELEHELLTPVLIGLEIDSDSPPSSGAINAIFSRWSDMGFAHIEKKPLRFAGFTIEGLTLGVAVLREKHRRNGKLKSANESRRIPSVKRKRN